jgi:hypothetical protein
VRFRICQSKHPDKYAYMKKISVLTLISPAHPRSSRYWPRCLARRQASPPTGRRRRHLHLLFRLHQDPREHPQGHLRRRRQHIRIPHPQPVEGDQAHPESAGGVRRRPARREEILEHFLGAMFARFRLLVWHFAIGEKLLQPEEIGSVAMSN